MNLQAGSTILFAELPDKATTLHQCEARAHRQGQHSSVLVYIVIADDPSDRNAWKALKRSDVRVGRILDGHGHTDRPTMAVDGVATAASVAAPHGESRSVSAATGGGPTDAGSTDSGSTKEVIELNTSSDSAGDAGDGDGEGLPEIKTESDQRHSVDSGRVSVDGGRRVSVGGDEATLAANDEASGEASCEVCVEEVLPVGAALFFLVSPHTGWVHLVQPDGTRLVRADGKPLCFPWDALGKEVSNPHLHSPNLTSYS